MLSGWKIPTGNCFKLYIFKNVSMANVDRFFLLFSSVANEFKGIVLSTAMQYSTKEEWLSLYNKALDSSSNAEKLVILRALASTEDVKLLKL